MHQGEISKSIKDYFVPLWLSNFNLEDSPVLQLDGDKGLVPSERDKCSMFINFVDDRNISLGGSKNLRAVRGIVFFTFSALNNNTGAAERAFEMSDFASSKFVNYTYCENDLIYTFFDQSSRNLGLDGSYNVKTLTVPFTVQYKNN